MALRQLDSLSGRGRLSEALTRVQACHLVWTTWPLYMSWPQLGSTVWMPLSLHQTVLSKLPKFRPHCQEGCWTMWDTEILWHQQKLKQNGPDLGASILPFEHKKGCQVTPQSWTSKGIISTVYLPLNPAPWAWMQQTEAMFLYGNQLSSPLLQGDKQRVTGSAHSFPISPSIFP